MVNEWTKKVINVTTCPGIDEPRWSFSVGHEYSSRQARISIFTPKGSRKYLSNMLSLKKVNRFQTKMQHNSKTMSGHFADRNASMQISGKFSLIIKTDHKSK